VSGYGRGHYGSERLDRRPSAGRSWLKVAAVVGVAGTLAWLWWPWKTAVPILVEPSRQGILPTDALGSTSTQAYEDAVVATARDLRAAGATIELPPHLQHLMPRVEV
jgi:hypothetical protein